MPANAGVVPNFFLKAFIAIFHFVKMMVNFKKEYSLMNEKLQKVLEFLGNRIGILGFSTAEMKMSLGC